MTEIAKLLLDGVLRFIVLFSMLIVIFSINGHDLFSFTANPFAKNIAGLVVAFFVLSKAIPRPKSLVSGIQHDL
ncbi:hypothetical protein [Undibacterium sp.]|uniref:hypothetical protein n=1 Tax=Undibacterium sp. TaxID=1914977 RepID=UPI003751189C